ncbi:helix-turn-helix domain-containing protein [Salicibibacter cibarius]|uniref:Helix-turn-helix domain-containing protein n=1 Tax=Salicibibacter cibarius TaxID=2743000 RepID=A0A7T7CB41_9BACI|nr:helix-turn-helix domain-containing protein [Salicibibacter cibarius]QQK75500.1 helix-turn-helix domain-containing protein [Salicibibacter cibarius]
MANSDINLKFKGYQYQLYPTEDQETFINKTLGCSRYVFIHFLALWESEYKASEKGLSYHSCANLLPALKEELPWLQEVDATS